jgi:hypothetical protein
VQNKKKLIRRMAAFAVFVLALGVAAAVFTSVFASRARSTRREQMRDQRLQAVDGARSYLEELAGQIAAVPVDPTIAGEVQARYFEEVAEGRRFVWGMGADGAFLFGVPREDFARLNTAWNTHEASIVGQGSFVDRQDFLRQLVQQSVRLDQSDLAPDPEEPADTPWSNLRHYGDNEDWMVFSAPLRAADGSALGNLYFKMEDIGSRWEPWQSSGAEELHATAVAVCGFAAVFLWFLLPTWVYVDARERGVRRALLWSFLVLISLFVGFVVYLIARPEETTLKCPGCDREVNGGAYCPHCGRDLSSAFCSTCRYPLKPEWTFCPSCRTEIGSPALKSPPDEDTGPVESEGAPPTPEG